MTVFAQSFSIAGREVGGEAPCYVIAEGGVSHFGDMDKAFRLVDMAVDAGADAFKMQHFRTDRMIGPSAPEWRERMRPKELSDPQVARIKEYCDQRGITFLCTGHDAKSVEFLDRTLDVPAFKIGSGELFNWPSLADIAERGKPIILSTGMHDLADVDTAIGVVASAGNDRLAVLHCVTQYPSDPDTVNLSALAQIRAIFPGPIGYSDHSARTAVPLAAVALGAKIIERHITLERDIPNAQDWKVACDPSDFPAFVTDIRDVEASLGGSPKAPSEAELESRRWALKSLTYSRDFPAGHVIDDGDLTAMRPGGGIAPYHVNEFLGRSLARGVAAGDLVTEADVLP